MASPDKQLAQGAPLAFNHSFQAPSTQQPAAQSRAGSATIISYFEYFPSFGGGNSTWSAPLQSTQQATIAYSATCTSTAPPRRGRARSTTIVGGNSPLDCPVSEEEQLVANLAHRINRAERTRSQTSTLPTLTEATPVEALGAESAPHFQAHPVESTTSVKGPVAVNSPIKSAVSSDSHLEVENSQSSTSPFESTSIQGGAPVAAARTEPAASEYPTWPELRNNTPSPRPVSNPTFDTHVRLVEVPLPSPDLWVRLHGASTNMSYPNYLDSPGAGPSPNSRQAPPSPSQGMHQNGMNGGMGLVGGMVGFPTPAGHQSDLNYIMQMVEELAGQLAHNQGLTAGIVDKMGKVRAKAKNLDVSNDELLAIAASELNVSSENLEKENSELRKALEKAIYEKKENWKLAVHGANILADILEKMHKFKAQHEAETLAWHRNYRKQLADEREENLNLRNQINDMKAAACRANEHLRQMRRYLTDHDELHELRVQNIALRQERRIWKRMAMPLIPDDDSEWSDDDDIIDPEEKKRLAAEKAEKERKDKVGEEGDDAPGASAVA